MANASVDKLKALGIRHGEKAVVGLTATLFVVCTVMAILRPTLDMKPEDLSTRASNAEGNLQKRQPEADVLAKLEKDGLIEPNLVKVVDNQLKNSIKPDGFKAKLEWVTPEPGAGLIRDQPELIAPTAMNAFPGRGGVYMYTLDDKGERIIETAEEAKKRSRGRKAGPPGFMGGSAMGNGGMGGGPPRDEKPEDKKRREAEEEKKKALFAGKAGDKEKEKGKEEAGEDPAVNGPWKEETKGKRWVVITGVIDNEQLKKNYLLALKNPAIAYPNYKRLDVERRNQQSDGSWTEWAATDQNKNYEVLDNLPLLETEYVPETKRPAALVDPLPFLKAGYWTGVHVASLVPPEVIDSAKKTSPGPGSGMMGAAGEGGGSRQGGGGGMPGPGGGVMGSGGGGKFGPGGMMSGGMMAGGAGGGGPAGGSGAGGSSEEVSFTKLEEKSLMLRSIDFTVEPDNTYQFRVRIVVVNPNKDHTDVNPGVDVDSKELLGPWSDPTDAVTLPADVSAYAQAPEPSSRRDDMVSFQVVKWDSGTGETFVKNDGAGPGELIGEYGSSQKPSSEGKGPQPATIDFNSRAIVFDTYGGSQKLPDIGIERNQFVVPALALILEPNGEVVIRDQGRDKSDEVREDMEENYRQAIANSTKVRESGSGSRMGGFGKKNKKKRR